MEGRLEELAFDQVFILTRGGPDGSTVSMVMVISREGFTRFDLGSAAAIFMMRHSFEAVPRELEEAALVDGCTTFSALRRILLRAVRPGLLTVGLFAFLASWNDFFAPLILLSDGSKFTLPVAVVSMRAFATGALRG